MSLPTGDGRILMCSLELFERKCLEQIQLESYELEESPKVVELWQDAVRMCREYQDYRSRMAGLHEQLDAIKILAEMQHWLTPHALASAILASVKHAQDPNFVKSFTAHPDADVDKWCDEYSPGKIER